MVGSRGAIINDAVAEQPFSDPWYDTHQADWGIVASPDGRRQLRSIIEFCQVAGTKPPERNTEKIKRSFLQMKKKARDLAAFLRPFDFGTSTAVSNAHQAQPDPTPLELGLAYSLGGIIAHMGHENFSNLCSLLDRFSEAVDTVALAQKTSPSQKPQRDIFIKVLAKIYQDEGGDVSSDQATKFIEDHAMGVEGDLCEYLLGDFENVRSRQLKNFHKHKWPE